ncbi:colicin E3-like toxin immunity protein [Pseudomonas frederiksbergensis]|uniref:colicin E3-like toxin immunity protein n=1 Tax=Pseudomonas frederiksbergensis TaxID=104087 RepID=UPI003D213CE6
MMGLKLRLEWYDRTTESYEGEEYSNDLGDDDSVLGALDIPVETSINNGGFNVERHWVTLIQPYFQHSITFAAYHYQIAFDYREKW